MRFDGLPRRDILLLSAKQKSYSIIKKFIKILTRGGLRIISSVSYRSFVFERSEAYEEKLPLQFLQANFMRSD